MEEENPKAAWPSDTLPLWIAAALVACYALRFGEARFFARPAEADQGASAAPHAGARPASDRPPPPEGEAEP